MNVTIFGKGNMGQALAKNLKAGGNQVNFVTHESDAELGEIVILAVPYSAFSDILNRYKEKLAGKVVIDISNPVNQQTFDGLDVPADSSAAAEIQKQLPQSHVLKAFNTIFAPALSVGQIGERLPVNVLVAGDSKEAKDKLIDALQGSPLAVLDAGSLKRARELEALGFLQITLAASEQISWNNGFAIIK